ncbi:MAG TPA: hypothetical protein DCY35_11525 [Prolixibacteraceae bacterium]|nr:hypothetical protein [Prolixibacteraceae bacterium]
MNVKPKAVCISMMICLIWIMLLSGCRVKEKTVPSPQQQSGTQGSLMPVQDGDSIYAPWILVDGITWKMYFGGWLTRDDHLSGDKIYYMESLDKGSTWSKPRLALHEEGHSFNDPSVVMIQDAKSGETLYLMYFTDRVHAESDSEPNPQISLATSKNGIDWEYRGIVIGYDNGFDNNQAWSPSAWVDEHVADKIYVYYHTRNSQGRILRSILVNGGTQLLQTNAVIDTAPDKKMKLNATIAKINDLYLMVFNESYMDENGDNSSRIVFWKSENGENWQRDDNYVLYAEKGKWVASPFIIYTDGGCRLYFGRGNIKFPRKMDIFSIDLPCPSMSVSVAAKD